MRLKKLPIGQSSFERIIETNSVYVDKTEKLNKLITEEGFYFLFRSRRFCKSLQISTLEHIFKDKKELFKGLWIYSSDYKWEEYAVIEFDFNSIFSTTSEYLEKSLINSLDENAKKFNVILKKKILSQRFQELVKKVKKTHSRI